jgi:hypothetical protein
MSYSSTTDQCQVIKQEVYNLIDWSSQWHMKDADDVASYVTVFWALCEPLLTSYYMSLTECEDLFWQGFYPDDHVLLSPKVEQQNWDLLQNVLPQFVDHSYRTLPAPSSHAYTPSPPISESLTLPTNVVNSPLSVPVYPMPVSPSAAPDLIARVLVLPDCTLLTSLPSSPPTLSRPKGPRPMPASSTSLILQSPQAHRVALSLPIPSQPSLVSSPSPSVSPPSI